MTNPVVVIDSRRRWHELLLLLLSVIYGVAFLTGGAKEPGSLLNNVPGWQVVCWSVLLLGSGATGLPGCLVTGWRPRCGLALELVGMSLGAGALIMYDYGLIALGDSRAAFSIGLATAWMTANILRGLQVAQDLRRLR